MAGFRDTDKTAAILRLLDLPWLDEIADQLDEHPDPVPDPAPGGHRASSRLSGPELHDRLQELRTAAAEAELARTAHSPPGARPTSSRAASSARALRVFAQTNQLVDRYPDDPGVLVTLLLNHVVLAAGEAMFIAAGRHPRLHVRLRRRDHGRLRQRRCAPG